MNVSKCVGFVTVLAAGVLGSSAWADASATPTERGAQAGCILAPYQVTSVRPYVREVNNGKRVVSRDLRGAELYLQAEPGVTREWLTAQLQQHTSQMGNSSMPGCPLGVPGTTVEVTSAGPGFVVRLIAPNHDQAEKLLRLARTLEG